MRKEAKNIELIAIYWMIKKLKFYLAIMSSFYCAPIISSRRVTIIGGGAAGLIIIVFIIIIIHIIYV